MENFLSCFRLAQCYMTINSVKREWQHFIRSLDSERRKRQHLKNQVQWYGRRESKHHFRAYNVRSWVQQPMFGERQNALLVLSKAPQRRQSGAGPHDFGSLHRHKRKAPEVSPRLCVMDRPRQQTRNSFERTRMAETQALFTVARRQSRIFYYINSPRQWCREPMRLVCKAVLFNYHHFRDTCYSMFLRVKIGLSEWL